MHSTTLSFTWALSVGDDNRGYKTGGRGGSGVPSFLLCFLSASCLSLIVLVTDNIGKFEESTKKKKK